MKTGIEIFGNIKKLALAAAVLMCANVEDWGQAEHVDYTVVLSINITPESKYYYLCIVFEAINYEGQTIWIYKSAPYGSCPYSYDGHCAFELTTGEAANIKSIEAVTCALKLLDNSYCCTCSSTKGILYHEYNYVHTVHINDRISYGSKDLCTPIVVNASNDFHEQAGGNTNIQPTLSVVVKPKKPSIIKFVGANNISQPASATDKYMVNDRGTKLQASYIDVYGGNMQYNWEFKCGNTIKQISTVGSSVGFTGNAVFGVDEFLKMVENKTPIYVKTKLCDISSDEIILHPKLSSPTVASIEQTPPSCNGASDGKAVIRFSRAVYNKELLQFAVGGVSNTAHTVPPGSDTFTLTGLSAGIDTIIISGKYPYLPNN